MVKTGLCGVDLDLAQRDRIASPIVELGGAAEACLFEQPAVLVVGPGPTEPNRAVPVYPWDSRSLRREAGARKLGTKGKPRRSGAFLHQRC